MIKAVIYDMDGVLIDSEPFWRRAEIEIFSEVGVELNEDMCRQTMGLRVDEVVDYWYHRHPWTGRSQEELAQAILDRVIELVETEGCAKEGVRESLEFFKSKGLKIALASSSNMRLIDAVLKKLEIREYFEVIRSAEHEDNGKPHPAVFLSTAKDLNVEPANCAVIEDSVNGMIAAKAAKMQCIGVPEDLLKNDKRLGIANIILSSLAQIDDVFWKGSDDHWTSQIVN